jgi:hypothetical protein
LRMPHVPMAATRPRGRGLGGHYRYKANARR